MIKITKFSSKYCKKNLNFYIYIYTIKSELKICWTKYCTLTKRKMYCTD